MGGPGVTASVSGELAAQPAGLRRGEPSEPTEAQLEVQELIVEAKRGDKAAFAKLYRLHVQSVYKYLTYRLRDTATAEDLTAEVFLRALRKIGDFEYRGIDFSAWLLRIARNILLDHVKSSGSRLEVVGIPEE
ncbi:MAG: sigma-70 family RNA polymerase sigma factor, partial [Actinobacteria bacterium]|nr:sigma-70 family RNA polymerase sigma factor [Actinomycetota bacterium]